ncbi:hypothetical protein RR42_m4244 [Cupriavidus basilensis]|uniref:Uncharacterized protein n=1 Tax=Cupriavidus basilensis TaxID=68895 RepID=A0A0C4YLX4_9BURK|nr:hypothetical protein RR42_m4244 [Cupriavidus basilensis]
MDMALLLALVVIGYGLVMAGRLALPARIATRSAQAVNGVRRNRHNRLHWLDVP